MTVSNYGLVHGDLHQGNLLLEGTQIFLFDFDDCEYHWFAHDIAMIFFYLSQAFAEPQSPSEFWAKNLPPFWSSYQQFYPLPLSELADLPDFILLREALLYALVHQVEDLSQASPEFLERQRQRRQRLESQSVNLDWPEIFARLKGP